MMMMMMMMPTARSRKEVEAMFQYHLYVRPSEGARLVETVYEYWMKKRKADDKPLMRRYWPITNVADNNPHHVFRPRGEGRRQLRKKKNDMNSYHRMSALKEDLHNVLHIIRMLRRRERLKREEVEFVHEIFLQQLSNQVIGQPRSSPLLERKRREAQEMAEARAKERRDKAAATDARIAQTDSSGNVSFKIKLRPSGGGGGGGAAAAGGGGGGESHPSADPNDPNAMELRRLEQLAAVGGGDGVDGASRGGGSVVASLPSILTDVKMTIKKEGGMGEQHPAPPPPSHIPWFLGPSSRLSFFSQLPATVEPPVPVYRPAVARRQQVRGALRFLGSLLFAFVLHALPYREISI